MILTALGIYQSRRVAKVLLFVGAAIGLLVMVVGGTQWFSRESKTPIASDRSVKQSGQGNINVQGSQNTVTLAPAPPTPPQPAKPPAAPPLRRPIEQQANVLRECIQDMAKRTGASEMWLSQIFRGTPPVFPTGPEVDVPAALRYLDSRGEVEILEKMSRPYQTWYEVFNEDIRFKVKALASR